MLRKIAEIESTVGDDSDHSRAAIRARNCHAVCCGIDDARELQYGLVDFGGRNVFALPAEGISDPVDEAKIAALIQRHQIAGTKPGVSGCEHIAQNLLLGLLCIGTVSYTHLTLPTK